MKYAQTVGFLASLIAIGACFFPWVAIGDTRLIVTGLNSSGTHFGKPGLFIIYTCSIAAILFLIPSIWAKRINVFIAAFAICWAIRNYLILSACYGGECPQKQTGLFILLAATILVMVMALLPKISIGNKHSKA